MTDGPRPRPGGSQRGPTPDPVRRPAPGVTDLRTRLRSGYGSPEGVVYAGTGALHQDTDPAGSGKVWKKTTPSGNTGWMELGAGGGGGGGPFLRLAWCDAGGTEADFNGSTNSFEKLLTFENPGAIEQSGGFVFSDHPTAASIDWAGPTVVAPNHTLHRITVPENGIYTVMVNHFFDVSFATDVNYIQVEHKIWPDTREDNAWFHPFLTANTSTVQQAISAAFTVELDTAHPFWITARPFGMLSDGTEASGDLLGTVTSDASLTVWKDTGVSGGGLAHGFSGDTNGSTQTLVGSGDILKCTNVWTDPDGLYDTATGKYSAPEAGWYQIDIGFHPLAIAGYLEFTVPGTTAGPEIHVNSDDVWVECGGLTYISAPGDIFPVWSGDAGDGEIRSLTIAKLA